MGGSDYQRHYNADSARRGIRIPLNMIDFEGELTIIVISTVYTVGSVGRTAAEIRCRWLAILTLQSFVRSYPSFQLSEFRKH